MKPSIIPVAQLDELRSQHPELTVADHVDLAVSELFDIAYPAKKDSKTDDEVAAFAAELMPQGAPAWGNWVFYPWLNTVVHMPPAPELRALRTSRNRNLITIEEQRQLYAATILIAGMSVGSNVVEALVSQGIAGKLILVDMDIIEPSNLNRIRAPYHHVSLHKVEAISRKVWEIDPYIDIVAYEDGLDDASLEDILEHHAVNIIVDEVDDLRMKLVIREQAMSRQLPVIMATDDGDDILIDIERYDLDDALEPFEGRIPADILHRVKAGGIPRPELGMIIGRYFVGPEHIPLRMFQSLSEVGKTLPSWPQLGGAAALSGIAVAYAVKKILLGLDVRQGRTLISLDAQLGLEHMDPDHQQELQRFQAFLKGR